MSTPQRRQVIGSVLDCAFVARGQGLNDRVWVYPRGRAPADLLPSGAVAMTEMKPWTPSRDEPRALPGRAWLDWSESRLRRTVAPLLGGREVWPPFVDFQAAGLAIAHAQLARHGGRCRWAEEFELAWAPNPVALTGWSEQRVRDGLAEVLADRTSWPTQEEFFRIGKRRLRMAAGRYGSPEQWAHEFGVTFPNRARRSRQRWTAQATEDALREFVGDRPDFPARSEFKAAGLDGLHGAIERAGGRRELAGRLGLTLPNSRYVRAPSWTDAKIEQALAPLLAGRTTWPPRSAFAEAGLETLYSLLVRSPGGHNTWAQRYGLPRVRERKPRHARASSRVVAPASGPGPERASVPARGPQ
jgi:hypothetical protein